MYSPVMYGGSQRKEVVTTLYPPVGVNRPPTADEWTQTKKRSTRFCYDDCVLIWSSDEVEIPRNFFIFGIINMTFSLDHIALSENIKMMRSNLFGKLCEQSNLLEIKFLFSFLGKA